MAVVTACARQPLLTAPDNTRSNQVFHNVTGYLESNSMLVHNVESATMLQNAPPRPLPPGGTPMTPTSTATYLGKQHGASTDNIALPPNLVRHPTCTLVIARIAALSIQALAYFLQAVVNAALWNQALHLTNPKQMLLDVRHAWAIHGHRLAFLPAAVHEASAPYYGGYTDHLGPNAQTAHTAAHLHCLMHNHEQEVQEVFTRTLREAQQHRNTSPQHILQQRGLSTTVGTQVSNQVQLLPPHRRHVIQTNHKTINLDMFHPTHGCRWRINGGHDHSEPSGQPAAPSNSNTQPDSCPPASGHTPHPLPTTPGMAKQVTG